MLTASDIARKFKLTLAQVATLHAARALPEPAARIGGKPRWREEDVQKFAAYLKRRHRFRCLGRDPDGPDGPPPPVYSHPERPRFDPRIVRANQREAERQRRSRTLAKGATPIEPQPKISLPEPKSTEVSEGQQ